MPRAWFWLQLLAGWLPVWALYTALIASQHGLGLSHAGAIAARATLPAAGLGLLLPRLARRVPWPRPFRLRFALLHLLAAPAYAVAWLLASSVLESVLRGRPTIASGPMLLPFLFLGVWLYAVVAGVSYAVESTERAARAEAAAARTQLAALRAQLHPHFLFNALHTVVHLIPTDPARAADAAELVAGLLRTTIEEERDLVSLRDEWAFVARYLEVERIRFGDRLRVRADIGEALLDAGVPAFALQTLVENAVRHGAAPRVGPTDLAVTAVGTADTLTLVVRDTGDGPGGGGGGAADRRDGAGPGTGLARLRERLAVLHGGAARLDVTAVDRGVEAVLVLPRAAPEDA